MTRDYRMTFLVEVELLVEDEVMERALSPDFPYQVMDEEATVEMLGRCIGIYGTSLDNLDGWGDFEWDDVVMNKQEIDLDSWERLPDIE